MPRETVKINSITGGISPTFYLSNEDEYVTAIAIDPEYPVADSNVERRVRNSGVLRPVAYESFDGALVTGNPYWILTNPKDALIYVYTNNGRIISYNSSLASETGVGTATTSSGNGAAYYNNYFYFATNTNISRYGPLDGTPTLTNSVWTGTTLGSQIALVNTTYPSIRGSGTLPNHPMHVHSDNRLYVGDFDSTSGTASTRNRGLIHAIRTTYSVTEGTGNDSSTYNVLDLPFGFLPTDIESYGEDLVIAAIQTTNATIQQGKAHLFFWDTFASSFYRAVPLPDTIVTALFNNNGILYIWGGKMSTGNGGIGYNLYEYLGGTTVRKIVSLEDGHPPLAGAVDSDGDRIIWGGWQTYPANAASVWAYGSRSGRLPSALHNIARSTSVASATDGVVTALKNVLRTDPSASDLPTPGLVLGWRDASNVGLDRISATYQTHYWRSRVFNVNQSFGVRRIKLSLGAAVAESMTVTPLIYYDDASGTAATIPAIINNTNFAGSERRVELFADSTGENNFFLELQWTGTSLLPVLLPIEIEIEKYKN